MGHLFKLLLKKKDFGRECLVNSLRVWQGLDSHGSETQTNQRKTQ